MKRPILALLFLIATCSMGQNFTGFSPPSFDSCTGGSSFKIYGSDLSGECIFTDPDDTQTFAPLVASEDSNTFICELGTFLNPNNYSIAVTGYQALPTNLVVTASEVSPPNCTVAFSNTYLAGQSVVIDVFSTAFCGTTADCDDGGNLIFTFNFEGAQTGIVPTFAGVVNTACQYEALITVQGTYNFTVLYNNSAFYTGSFLVDADITTLNQSDCSINTSELNNVVAGSTACANLTLVDSYGNVIKPISASQIPLVWVNSTVSTVQGKTLTRIGETDRLCFQPLKSGVNYLDIRINDISLHGAPVAVTVVAAAFNAANSNIRDSAVCPPNCTSPTLSVTVTAGALSGFTIVPRDIYKNLRTSNSDVILSNFTASLISISTGPTYPATVSLSGAYLLASYTPLLTGQYVFKIYYGGVALDSGSFPSVAVVPSAVSYTLSTFNITSLTIAAGVSFTTTLVCKDAYGNLVTQIPWVATLVNNINNTNCAVSEVTTGNYQATCQGIAVGTYALTYFYAGQSVAQTKPVTITPAPISAITSYFGNFQSSIQANASATLTIYTFDAFGNVGGTFTNKDKFQVQIQQSAQASSGRFSTSTVAQVGTSNQYLVNFQLTVAGNYTIQVIYNGNLLKSMGVPNITTYPGPTVGIMSLLTLTLASPTTDTITPFTLYAKDAFGNVQIYNELAQFAISALYIQNTSISVICAIQTTSTPGVYNVSCPLKLVGEYTMSGTYAVNQPFTSNSAVEVNPGAVSIHSSYVPKTTGNVKAIAGALVQVEIQGADFYYNVIRFAADFNVSITAANGSSITLIRTVDANTAVQGISIYTYNVTLAGTYTFSTAIIGGGNIIGSPSSLVVSPAPANVNSATFSINLSQPIQKTVNDTVTMTVYFKDQYSNPIGTSDTIQASLIGLNFAGAVDGIVVPVAGGFTLSFTPNIGGQYYLSLVVNGKTVPVNATLEFFSTSGGVCTTFNGTLNQGQQWSLVCTAYDVYGKPKTVGGDTVTWVATGADVTVKDLMNGRYTVVYSSQDIGQHTLTISINGKQVAGMPYYPVIIPGPAVLAGVIVAMFVLGVLIVGFIYWYRQRQVKKQQLLKKKRKPQQVFKPGEEGEWSDEENFEEVEPEENWMASGEPKSEKLKMAHALVMNEIES